MSRATVRRVAGVVTVAVPALEGLLLVVYAVSIAVVAVTQGLSGPDDVSSPAGTVVEVVVFLLFGSGLLLIANGRRRDQDWATVPYVLAQLLALMATVPMATGSGAGVPVGIVASIAAVAGLVALPLARAASDQPAGEAAPAAHRRTSSERP